MDQEKFFQVFEARYSKITRHDCLQVTKRSRNVSWPVGKHNIFKAKGLSSDLHALLTGYPDADISCLDHVDIICTITLSHRVSQFTQTQIHYFVKY